MNATLPILRSSVSRPQAATPERLGKYEIIREVGRGSTFYLEFPSSAV